MYKKWQVSYGYPMGMLWVSYGTIPIEARKSLQSTSFVVKKGRHNIGRRTDAKIGCKDTKNN